MADTRVIQGGCRGCRLDWLENKMANDAQNMQLLLDEIPCGAQERPELKLVYNSAIDGNTPQAFLNKCALLSPTVTVLSYVKDNVSSRVAKRVALTSHATGLQGHLGFYMSNPWCTKTEGDQYSGMSYNGLSKHIQDDDAFLFYDFPSHDIKGVCHAQHGGIHFGVQTNGGYGIYIGRNAELCLFRLPSGNSIANLPFKGAGNLHVIQNRVPSKVEVYAVELGKYTVTFVIKVKFKVKITHRKKCYNRRKLHVDQISFTLQKMYLWLYFFNRAERYMSVIKLSGGWQR